MNLLRAIFFALLIAMLGATAASAAKKSAKPKEAPAQETSRDNVKDTPKAFELACAGPFARDTTHAKLVAEFGAANVTFRNVDVASDVKTQASVIFDGDLTKRVVVTWKDNKTRARPKSITVSSPSTWTGPGGVHNGLSLKDMVKLNGAEFQVKGFGSIGGGGISGLQGPFINIPGDCTLQIAFEPGIANPLPPRFASVTGDQLIASKNLVLRRVRPQVAQWSLTYP
ncbi:MAG: hypothetical protein BGN84_07440 [Afipia sp. 62-7]|nr:hypothetical protein [Afipia sp.]OJU19874.1 MAG: hypothetical protein BGN84_07440 [Afipia sp. 62-7]